ncbi:MAG: hypothetical protein NZ927_02910 [Candidatus Calescibacterium sp.]|nr:hypothetical protein [Candidatus Calescibacterium sp.]MDW8086418.1 hypothetical protein [Candidatus Calescibacterium sp.]
MNWGIRDLKWETEASGIKFGEIVFSGSDFSQKVNPISDLHRYNYIVARLNPEDLNFVEKLYFLFSEKFSLSDTFAVISMKIPRFGRENFSRWNDYCILNGKDLTSREELLNQAMTKMKVSRYFNELPYQIAEKIYRRWLNEIIDRGVSFVFLERSNFKIKGFLGFMVESGRAKNFILFGEGISFVFLIKHFVNFGSDQGIKDMEFKISLKNLRALRVISRWIRNIEHQINFELVFSKINI